VPTARYRVVPRASLYVYAKDRCNCALLVSITCANLNSPALVLSGPMSVNAPMIDADIFAEVPQWCVCRLLLQSSTAVRSGARHATLSPHSFQDRTMASVAMCKYLFRCALALSSGWHRLPRCQPKHCTSTTALGRYVDKDLMRCGE
jgi:hypothetical protein